MRERLRLLGQERAARTEQELGPRLVANTATRFGAARQRTATHGALRIGDQRETLHTDDAVEITRRLRTDRLFDLRRHCRRGGVRPRRGLDRAPQRLALLMDAGHDALELAFSALADDLDRLDRILEHRANEVRDRHAQRGREALQLLFEHRRNTRVKDSLLLRSRVVLVVFLVGHELYVSRGETPRKPIRNTACYKRRMRSLSLILFVSPDDIERRMPATSTIAIAA